MYDNISSKQLRILEFIKRELHKKGYPPSVREICEAVGLRSTSTVHGHLEKLEKYGYIRRDPTKPRAIEIVDHNPYYTKKELVELPLVGKVTAGEPILAVENIEDTFPLPLDFISNNGEKSFILTIQGSSMINAGILDGDYVIVRQQSTAPVSYTHLDVYKRQPMRWCVSLKRTVRPKLPRKVSGFENFYNQKPFLSI